MGIAASSLAEPPRPLAPAIRLGAILDDRALVDEIKGRLLFVAENLLEAPEDAFLFMW